MVRAVRSEYNLFSTKKQVSVGWTFGFDAQWAEQDSLTIICSSRLRNVCKSLSQGHVHVRLQAQRSEKCMHSKLAQNDHQRRQICFQEISCMCCDHRDTIRIKIFVHMCIPSPECQFELFHCSRSMSGAVKVHHEGDRIPPIPIHHKLPLRLKIMSSQRNGSSSSKCFEIDHAAS